jgi:hypothetical protein
MRIFITESEGQFEDNLDESITNYRAVFKTNDVSFESADIGPGASVTAILAEYKDTMYVGVVVALFFAGKKIEENLVAWGAILDRCVSLYQKIKLATVRTRVTVDNQTAALIAFQHILSLTNSNSYRLMNIFGVNGYIQEIIDCSKEPIGERQASTFLYYLCLFQLDDFRYYEVIVKSSGEVISSTLMADDGDSSNASEQFGLPSTGSVQKRQETLSAIFTADTGYSSEDADVLQTSPNYSEISEFAELLSANPDEETLQQFVSRHPKLLMGLYGWGDDSVLAFLTKPTIGTRFRGDFALLQYGQGGCVIHLVELEPSSERLFTKNGHRAKRHNGAITQCRDWTGWIQANKATFVRDLLETVRMLPEFPDRSSNGSFRRRDYTAIESAWRGFGGFDDPQIQCTIIIGRWSQMTLEERRHLVTQNRHDDKLAKVITYEQLARTAFERPTRNV